MGTIHISNLRLRAIIGINDWERTDKQDIIINIHLTYKSAKAEKTDNLKDTVDYKALTKRIIKHVETSQFQLLEKLVKSVLNIILENPLVKSATVRIDKPQALRFADSVAVELTEEK
jgi:D-erythro-7,8-dihydroneopterin triphosphate epimerase